MPNQKGFILRSKTVFRRKYILRSKTVHEHSEGFIPLFSLLAVLLIGAVIVSSKIPITKSYPESNILGTNVEAKMKKEAPKVATMEGKAVVIEKDLGAVSKFPLQIDQKTNALTVTTPAGSKTVTILPDEALNNLLSSRVITEVDSSYTKGSLASLSRVVDLEDSNGVLVYKVSGKRKNLVFGLIPIKTSVVAYVSAENGEVIQSSQSFLGRILNRISKTAD